MAIKLKGRGRLPSPDRLKTRSTDQLLTLLDRFGRRPVVGELESMIMTRLMRHVDVEFFDDDLADEIALSIERGVKRWLVNESRKAIQEYRIAKMTEAGVKKTTSLRWLAVVDKGTCKSCVKRHQKVRQLRTWEKRGLPGSDSLICKSMCRCHLVPMDYKFPGEV